MGSEKNIHELIVRLFADEATPDEKKIIDSWIEESQENRILFNDLKEVWIQAKDEADDEEYHVDEAIERFLNRIRKKKNKEYHQTHRITNLLRYAALFIIFLAIPATWYWSQKTQSDTNLTTTILCAYGDRTTIYLPDSSKVCLNSGSRITFNNRFNQGVRNIFLEGEAYFSVRKNPESPFIVQTNDMDVKVLGTEFNLKAYPDEKKASVTLVKGSLQVSNNMETVMVIPGQKLLYETMNHAITIENLSDLAPEMEWINGRMVFRNESLGELELKLERWFDVEIEFADELVQTRRFSGILERESILEVISYFGNSQFVDYHIEGNRIIFRSENVHPLSDNKQSTS
ncbi:MAG: FecR domain-containing protein [Mariniphaga sp.]|nr:FecR domain-containing protein [Mariniphaga sp.]MDD4225139.1 FecR domain-containing protein [Mariniphaga sp.]MDD4426096.1 FecR domain-containing protein [Mariniphaga sp.]